MALKAIQCLKQIKNNHFFIKQKSVGEQNLYREI